MSLPSPLEGQLHLRNRTKCYRLLFLPADTWYCALTCNVTFFILISHFFLSCMFDFCDNIVSFYSGKLIVQSRKVFSLCNSKKKKKKIQHKCMCPKGN